MLQLNHSLESFVWLVNSETISAFSRQLLCDHYHIQLKSTPPQAADAPSIISLKFPTRQEFLARINALSEKYKYVLILQSLSNLPISTARINYSLFNLRDLLTRLSGDFIESRLILPIAFLFCFNDQRTGAEINNVDSVIFNFPPNYLHARPSTPPIEFRPALYPGGRPRSFTF